MLESFNNSLSELVSNPKAKTFLLAVSGGLDSIVMTELFRLSGCKYAIAHCNFQLRGEESEEDLKFVKNEANKSKAPFFFVKFETEKFCKENKVSIQMGARELRYKWLEETRQQNKLDYIVTAHHADDAIETFFINLLRGTGISGLHGIKAKNENTIRPLLGFYRNEIEKFAKENKLQWREDSSNNTDKYERNKIRHHLLPMLQEINAKAKDSITATIENLSRAEQLLADSINKATAQYTRQKDGKLFIHFNFFKELNPAVEYLYEMLKGCGFNYEQCKQIEEAINKQSGKIFLTASHRAVIDREEIIVELITHHKDSKNFEIEIEQKDLQTNKYYFQFERFERNIEFDIPREKETAVLDFDKLIFPLQIRKWEVGDKFHPLGINKSKKVSDFLIDNKVSLPDKEHTYVLLSGGEIAWLIGQRIDDRFKVTSATKNIYLCKLQKA